MLSNLHSGITGSTGAADLTGIFSDAGISGVTVVTIEQIIASGGGSSGGSPAASPDASPSPQPASAYSVDVAYTVSGSASDITTAIQSQMLDALATTAGLDTLPWDATVSVVQQTTNVLITVVLPTNSMTQRNSMLSSIQSAITPSNGPSDLNFIFAVAGISDVVTVVRARASRPG